MIATRHQPSDILEQHQRLSRSHLWHLQRLFFSRQGINAWGQNTIPHYVTSNPYIAKTYGNLTLSFLRDWSADSRLDLNQPIYILELGAGSGRFAYHFLKTFLPTFDQSSLNHLPIKYILTDFTDSNLDFWRDHPSLNPYFDRNVLDLARFDMEQDTTLTLEHSQITLSANTLKNPLVVLATYVFDSIPQDAFSIRNGQLHETLVSLSTEQSHPDPNDPDLLNHLDITYDDHPIGSNYYSDPDLSTILAYYQDHLIDTTILFPSIGIQCLRRLKNLANNRLLLITGDKGYSHEADLNHRSQPWLNRHGSFSMMVNYHAIGQYIHNSGGQFFHTPHHHNSLNVCIGLFGSPPKGYTETTLTYKTTVEQLGPDDFFTLKKIIEQHFDTLTLPQILSYLRLSHWDAKILFGCYPALRQEITTASEKYQQDLTHTLENIWDTYYPIGEPQDLAMHIATLFYQMRDYTRAMVYLKQSLKLFGKKSHTAYKMALCHYRLGQMGKAKKWVERALSVETGYGPARKLQRKIGVKGGR